MILSKASVGLSLTVTIATLIFACQADVVQDSRSVSTGATARPAGSTAGTNSGNAQAEGPAAGNPDTPGTPAGTPPAAAAAGYTMAWDVSADAALVSYKVFVVPPDRNPRFPGKTDVPIQVKNYPIAGLQKNGTKYTVVVTGDEVKAALGATVVNPAAYCFTIVAVNSLGNSPHSPVICP